MYQKPVCQGGYGALNCKKSKAKYIEITAELRLSSVTGKTTCLTLNTLDLRSWILERAKFVKLSLGQSVEMLNSKCYS